MAYTHCLNGKHQRHCNGGLKPLSDEWMRKWQNECVRLLWYLYRVRIVYRWWWVMLRAKKQPHSFQKSIYWYRHTTKINKKKCASQYLNFEKKTLTQWNRVGAAGFQHCIVLHSIEVFNTFCAIRLNLKRQYSSLSSFVRSFVRGHRRRSRHRSLNLMPTHRKEHNFKQNWRYWQRKSK